MKTALWGCVGNKMIVLEFRCINIPMYQNATVKKCSILKTMVDLLSSYKAHIVTVLLNSTILLLDDITSHPQLCSLRMNSFEYLYVDLLALTFLTIRLLGYLVNQLCDRVADSLLLYSWIQTLHYDNSRSPVQETKEIKAGSFYRRASYYLRPVNSRASPHGHSVLWHWRADISVAGIRKRETSE